MESRIHWPSLLLVRHLQLEDGSQRGWGGGGGGGGGVGVIGNIRGLGMWVIFSPNASAMVLDATCVR